MFSLLCFDIMGIIKQDVVPFIKDTFQLDRMLFPVIFCIAGLSLTILARRITRLIRRKNDIDDKDMVYIVIKALALGCMFVALVFLVLTAMQYI